MARDLQVINQYFFRPPLRWERRAVETLKGNPGERFLEEQKRVFFGCAINMAAFCLPRPCVSRLFIFFSPAVTSRV